MNDCEGAEQQHQLARTALEPDSSRTTAVELPGPDSITTYISFGHSFSKIAFGPFSSLFFCLDYMKKKKKEKVE